MIDYEKEYRQIHRIAAEVHLRNDRLLDRLDSQKEEIEKLRAENERLQAANKQLVAGIDTITRRKQEEIEKQRAEIERLRKALEPLAQHYLWPDDLGEEFASLIRSDDDWSEEANEDADSDVFIKRKHIRAARHALEGKP